MKKENKRGGEESRMNIWRALLGAVFSFAALLFGLLAPCDMASAAADVVIYTNPSSISTSTGSDFSVDVMINPLDHYVSNADFYFTYDQTKFTLSSITSSATFTNVLSSSVPSPANGTGNYSASTPFGVHISTATVYATLNFHAIATATNSPITITPATMVYADNSPTYPSEAGTNVLGTRTNGTVTIVAADTTGPTFTINDGVSATPVKTDTINITVSDPSGVASRFYGFSTDNVCNASDTINTSFTSGTNFSITGNHSDYLCVKATDSSAGANVSYQLVGQLHVDNTAPSISATAPSTNSYIRSITSSSAVSYTLSEAIASGTIVFTRTGGTADGTVHTCTLKGTALNSGAHNNLDLSDTTNGCTSAQSLVSGTIYTVTFNATDAAGNNATQVSSTGVTFDNAAPSGGSLSYTNGYVVPKAIQLTVSDGADSGSGLDTASRIVQRRMATPAGGVCGAYGSWSTVAVSGSHPNLLDTGIAEGKCYQYQYLISDIAGNQAVISSVQTIKTALRGDLDADGGVGGADFSLLHTNYGAVGAGNVADINSDNAVNGADFSILHTQYGQSF